jgi:hypothetical protein
VSVSWGALDVLVEGWAGMRVPRPLSVVLQLVDWFEARGVYVPGEDNRAISPWRDFGWQIATWLITVGVFVIFFALAA